MRGVAADFGLAEAGHPLLGAVVESADGGRVVLSGRLSVAGQVWLADHVVHGAVVFPGTGFVELVVRAGEQVGCGCVEELVIEAPLVLPEETGVRLQVVVEKAEGERWDVQVFSLREDAVAGGSWTRHVSGVLMPGGSVGAVVGSDGSGSGFGGLVDVWPPVGAEVVGIEGFYGRAAEAGLVYGPVFRGLRGVWRRGEEVFAEVELGSVGVSGGFGVHPALLDAALHAVGVGGVGGVSAGVSVLPFSWSGVVVRGLGSGVLRVRLCGVESGDGVSLWAVDGSGVPVVSVERLALRAVTADQIGSAGRSVRDEALFGVEWTAVSGLSAAPEAGRWLVVG
ncbi:polyketide synthase dehydratase domain-containing protein, partial [Streptomyces sp. NPDC088554]|uniref:polyketide synthase dehydratase domain-containing protein n=2 Tax=unclassified Streptomyces TaxID=2593676 RepID=UPI0038000F6E